MAQKPFSRLVRWLGLDDNPLRRGLDRVESAIRLVTIAGAVAAVVFGIVLGVRTYGEGVRVEAEESRGRHATEARLLVDVPARTSIHGSVASKAQASWKTADGRQWTGAVTVPPGLMAGTVVPIWVDAKGVVTNAPRTREATVLAAFSVGAGLPVVMAVLAVTILGFTRFIVARRARLAWEREWDAVEPIWRRTTF